MQFGRVLVILGIASSLLWFSSQEAAHGGFFSSRNHEPYATLAKSVVKITNAANTTGGTGFAVKGKSGQEYILTNWHVCKVADQGKVYIRQASEVTTGLVVRQVPAHDLCAIQPTKKYPPLGLTVEPPARFEPLYVVGHPLLHDQTASEGRYTAEVKDTINFEPSSDGCPEGFTAEVDAFYGLTCGREFELYDTTVPIYPGNSGSPIINEDGVLVGIINSSSNGTHYGGAIPGRYIRELLDLL